ncbi:hypothetical protein BJ875DRAFT_51286 [Amylocarpus encephaloides]|uniref:FAD-binding domain-containing protein n=1 Tax=Amylocarpus encephaloides TaxID=45428 RepID=A0A9P8C4K0_9HELO|nr:hypothetical protein BJ875DRAFT_51286 [Amylocarpus encephaloides]
MAPTSDPKTPFHIAVVGGGIGGLCLTIGLLHNHVSCTIYEAASSFTEIGAGVSFGPNAVRAMNLLDPSIKKGYDKIGTHNLDPKKRLSWFDFRLGMQPEKWVKEGKGDVGKDGQWIANVEAGEVGQCSVHRAHFLDVLVGIVPEGVAEFGKRVEDVTELENGKMQMKFADGTTAEADAVIGCDGIKSRTRQLLIGENHPAAHAVFTGKYAYRGLIPMEKAVEALGNELAENSQMYMGHHGHVLTFPIQKGETMNVVAFRTKDGDWDKKEWVVSMKKEDMFKDFDGWGESVMKILPLMEKPDVWALFDHPPAPTYYKKRLAVLGDAAHASTPHQGAGAGQAVEDAYILSNLLGKVDNADEIEKVFKAYDAIRRPRSQKVVTTSRDAVRIYEFEDEELGCDLVNIKKRLEERYNWIWNADMNAQLQEALNLLDKAQESANL